MLSNVRDDDPYFSEAVPPRNTFPVPPERLVDPVRDSGRFLAMSAVPGIEGPAVHIDRSCVHNIQLNPRSAWPEHGGSAYSPPKARADG